jgi:flagellar basal body-associated protein FliL
MDIGKRSVLIVLWAILFALILFRLIHYLVFFGKNHDKDQNNICANTNVGMYSNGVEKNLFRVYVPNGRLKRRIKVGAGPHGLAVWPQPGRFSLGHTGNMR